MENRTMQKGETERKLVLRSECGAAAESKEENIRGLNGDQRTEGPVEERNGSRSKR